MKKLLVLSVCFLGLVGMILMGCDGSGGGSSTSTWTKPAWASEGTFPLMAYDTNGNYVGYVVGVDFEKGWVKLYNEDMGKFFEMTTGWGTIRGWSHRRAGVVYADGNCDPYMWQGWNNFLYYSHGEADLPPVDSKFFTISHTDGIPAVNITKELVYNDNGTEDIGDDSWECFDYDSQYWQDINATFYPMVPYTDALPFDHSAGMLVFSSE